MKNHPNQILSDEDVEQIRQLIDWKRSEIARIQSIASNAALAEKFEVSKRTIDAISCYETRRIRSPHLSYTGEQSTASRKKISESKLSKDNTVAGDYTRRTGIPAIDVIREMARKNTKTEVAHFFGWRGADGLSSWLKLRGFIVEFKRHIPKPPKRKGWGDIAIGAASRE